VASEKTKVIDYLWDLLQQEGTGRTVVNAPDVVDAILHCNDEYGLRLSTRNPANFMKDERNALCSISCVRAFAFVCLLDAVRFDHALFMAAHHSENCNDQVGGVGDDTFRRIRTLIDESNQPNPAPYDAREEFLRFEDISPRNSVQILDQQVATFGDRAILHR
jgi:hypothetical protein